MNSHKRRPESHREVVGRLTSGLSSKFRAFLSPYIFSLLAVFCIMFLTLTGPYFRQILMQIMAPLLPTLKSASKPKLNLFC